MYLKWNPNPHAKSAHRRFCLIYIDCVLFIAPIIVGGFIYLLWRPKTLFMFKIMKFLGLMPYVMKARFASLPILSILPKFIIYSLPNGLWAFSLIYGVLVCWRGQIYSKVALGWLGFAAFLVEGSEVAQALKVVPGTFDWNDMLWNTVGIVAALMASRWVERI